MGTDDHRRGIHPPVQDCGIPPVTYVTARYDKPLVPETNRRATVSLSLQDEI